MRGRKAYLKSQGVGLVGLRTGNVSLHPELHAPAAQQRPHKAEITLCVAIVASGSPPRSSQAHRTADLAKKIGSDSIKSKNPEGSDDKYPQKFGCSVELNNVNFQFWLRADSLRKPPFFVVSQ